MYFSILPSASRNQTHTRRFSMKSLISWSATAFVVAAFGSTIASGWLMMGGAAFGLTRSSFRRVENTWSSSSNSYRTARVAPRPVTRRGSNGVAAVGVRMQVWSNPQAVQDYKDLLDGNAPEDTVDQPSVIVGKGKLGTALASMGMGEDLLLGRGEAIPDTLPYSTGAGAGGGDGTGVLTQFPIYVCVPEDEVALVIDSCPEEKREDLVFVSSGCLEPLLKSRGLCRGEQTQATIFFSVDKIGGKAVDAMTVIGTDGRGDPKLAGETAVCGKWKGAFAMRLQRSPYDLHCSTEFYLEWRRVMFEKLIFDCAVNLVGALHKFPTVGYVVQYYTEELVDMLFELKNTLRSTLAVTLMNGERHHFSVRFVSVKIAELKRTTNLELRYPERLIAYGEEVGDRKTTRMDPTTFKWYNQFFYDISSTALKAKFGDPCPMHTEYLNYGKDNGIFSID